MRNTRANVSERAKHLTPIQIDGIPEGFSFKVDDVTIGGKLHKGQYVAYIPRTEEICWAYDIEKLLKQYNLHG